MALGSSPHAQRQQHKAAAAEGPGGPAGRRHLLLPGSRHTAHSQVLPRLDRTSTPPSIMLIRHGSSDALIHAAGRGMGHHAHRTWVI